MFGRLAVKTWLAYSDFKNYEKQTNLNQDGIEQVGTKQGAKKYQDGIGTDKPLFDGLVVKTRLDYRQDETEDISDDFGDFHQAKTKATGGDFRGHRWRLPPG